MKMIQTLPTDRHGNVYYGPKTYAQAVARISEYIDDAHPGESISSDISRMADRMEIAGYVRAAARVRKQYL